MSVDTTFDSSPPPGVEASSLAALRPGPPGRFRVLLVEDEHQVREAVCLMLAEAGCEVVTAENGVQALDRFRSRPLDLVITDLSMPVKDGYATIRELKTLAPEVKIIAISGAALQGGPQTGLEAARRLGADRILAKPFSYRELAAHLHGLLGRA